VSKHDKTEAPTAKKKREARQEGNIAKTPELVSWGGLLIASMVLPVVFAAATGSIVDLLREAGDAFKDPEPATAIRILGSGARVVAMTIAPIAGVMMTWGLLANVAQTKGSTSLSRLKPKFGRVNPLKGFKRLFSPQGLWQAGKVLLKSVILIAVAWSPLTSMASTLAASSRPPLPALAAEVADTALHVVRTVSMAGLALGAADYLMARRRIMQGMKMTKREVKDEARMSEGDPMVRAQIRQRQREASRNRMLAAVADASVIIVNPTHVAVALRYEPTRGAPVLVAKGRGVVAERIRDEAREHLVPLVRDIPLAWAIHDTCKVDRPIPPELFEAVARILAFVMTVARRSAMGAAVAVPGRPIPLPERVGRRQLRALPAGVTE